MSLIDKFVAAVTPPESDQDRIDARTKATNAATPGDWLDLILQHHRSIEDAFAQVKSAGDAGSRKAALKQLGTLLTGHSIAEEAAIYPALADDGEKMHASMGYEEQSAVKIQMALIEKLDPMSQEFADKLEHIEGAVAHHVYAEEGNWYIDLKEKASADDQALLTARYTEEFERYCGKGGSGSGQGLNPGAGMNHGFGGGMGGDHGPREGMSQGIGQGAGDGGSMSQGQGMDTDIGAGQDISQNQGIGQSMDQGMPGSDEASRPMRI